MKNWSESKTVWFNLVMVLVTVAPILADAVKAISPDAAALAVTVAGVVAAIGNVVLRVVFTEVPINTPAARARLEQGSGGEDERLP